MNFQTTESRGWEKRFDDALAKRDAGDLIGAHEALSHLAEEYPSQPGILGMLGSVQLELGRKTEAASSFRQATLLSPESELASLGLFHSLWESGDTDSAFAEMKRFVASAGPSEEYRRVLQEINEKVDRP
jgi:predicted Zn-dependent protease